MNKKADLSISTIVVMVLALLVLVIIVFVLFSSSDGFRSETSCLSQGGRCIDNFADCEGVTPSNDGCSGGQFCCPAHRVNPFAR
jgi:flagellar basal body-associated protein FliL